MFYKGSLKFLSYDQSIELLKRYADGSSWMNHCIAVSELSTCFANIFKSGYTVNTEFIRSASLLHDIGRYKTHDPIQHGVEGYRLLMSLGYEREAFICASHILFGLKSSEAVQYGLPERDFIPGSFEEKLIPLVDFLVEHDRPVSLTKRFSLLKNRNKNNKMFLSRLERAENTAKSFMEQLNQEFQCSMEELAVKFMSPKNLNCES
jgi:uncharacterized protein